jgi:hypothetical protein
MIGADDVTTVGPWFIDKSRAAVNTNIMECPDGPVGVFGQKQRLPGYLYRADGSSSTEMMGEFGKHPTPFKDTFPLCIKKRGIDISIIRQS